MVPPRALGKGEELGGQDPRGASPSAQSSGRSALCWGGWGGWGGLVLSTLHLRSYYDMKTVHHRQREGQCHQDLPRDPSASFHTAASVQGDAGRAFAPRPGRKAGCWPAPGTAGPRRGQLPRLLGPSTSATCFTLLLGMGYQTCTGSQLCAPLPRTAHGPCWFQTGTLP